MRKKIKTLISESKKVSESLLDENLVGQIETLAKAIVTALKSGRKVLIFGNGGSAADSQHMAAELVGRFKKERKPFPAIALTTNTSTITALSNDYGYEVSFSRQVEALGKAGDVAVGISTSGTAANVIAAAKKAKERKLVTAALTGKDGGKLKSETDIAIVVPANDTPRIQEAHILIIHILCELVEDGA